MAHGFGLTRRCGLEPFAAAFADAGYCVLLFDYRSFGDSDGIPRQVLSMKRQLKDWSAAVGFARAQSEVDPSRIVTFGSSLGAGHAVTTAVRDDNVQAAIALNPMWSGLSSTFAAMKGWSLFHTLQIVGTGLLDMLGSVLGAKPLLLPTSAPAGELGLLTSPDAYPGYKGVVPADFNFYQAARIALSFWLYHPGRTLLGSSVPVLAFPARPDTINPIGPTMRTAARCPNVRLVELECHHMEVYHDPFRTQILEAAFPFLEEVRSGESQSPP